MASDPPTFWVMVRPAYRLASRLVHRAPLPAGTLRDSLAGRRSAADRWGAWAREHRGDGPLLWLHAASVGEALAAEPVLARLLHSHPALQMIQTYSSPAVTGWTGRHVARRDYVPRDEPQDVRRTLDALRPAAVVFSRGDLWPELLWHLHARGIPAAILGATMRAGSLRLRPPFRSLYAQLLAGVSWIGAVSEEHAARWIALGAAPETVQVTGDPRHDQVLERSVRADVVDPLRAWAGGGHTLVAGSVEASDDRVAFDAARTVFAQHAGARLLVVPHDGTEAELERLAAGAHGLPFAIWQPGSPVPDAPVLLAEGRGLLFDLYALADVAYVGGGFRRGGLHAVIEPAAHGIPVVVGPRWQWSHDAEALVRARAGLPLPRRKAAASLARWWMRCGTEAHLCASMPEAVRQVLAPGAAQHTADRIGRMLSL